MDWFVTYRAISGLTSLLAQPMKRLTTYSLTTLGVVFIGLSAHAQVTVTTSTNAVPAPVSSPMIQPDTLRPNKPGMDMPQGGNRETRQNRRERRKNRNKTNEPATNRNDYRQNAGNGTASNNSNTTNYNSQNAVAPASGVNAVTAPSSGNGSSMSTATNGAGTASGSMTTGTTMGATTASGSSAVSGASTPGAIANPDRTVTDANRSKTLSVGAFISASPNHTTLQNALQTTTLDKTLQGKGPFTVFAPSNEAFKTLPAQTQRVLLEGQNVETLKILLANHVVAGEVDTAELMRRVKAGNGKATLQTLAGKTLTVQAGAAGQLNLTDEQGVTASITMPDHYETNGLVHGITKVLMPGGLTPFR